MEEEEEEEEEDEDEDCVKMLCWDRECCCFYSLSKRSNWDKNRKSETHLNRIGSFSIYEV
jgi:hypothetical protein